MGDVLWLDVDFDFWMDPFDANDGTNSLEVPWYFNNATIWTNYNNPLQNPTSGTFQARVYPGGYIAMMFTHEMAAGWVSVQNNAGVAGNKFDVYLYYDRTDDGQMNGKWYLSSKNLTLTGNAEHYDLLGLDNASIPPFSEVAVLFLAHPNNKGHIDFNSMRMYTQF